MKLLGKICAATAASALLLTTAPATAPVAHAGVNWGAAAGAIIGTLLGKTAGNSDKSGNSDNGLSGGLSNQKHAHPNPNNNEKLFMLAVAQHDFSTVQTTLDSGVDINGVYENNTAFRTALEKNDREMMQFLLEHGADVNGYYTYNNGYVCYMVLAIENNDAGLLKYLHDWGADINGKSWPSGFNALNKIIERRSLGFGRGSDISCAQYLADNGLDLDNVPREKLFWGAGDKRTPFLAAVVWGWRDMVDLLVEHGANLSARDENNQGAIELALQRKDVEYYKYIQSIMDKGQQPSKYQELKANAQKKN